MDKILLISGCSFTDKNFYSGIHLINKRFEELWEVI